MLSNILNIGINNSLDLEDQAKVKLVNAIALLAVTVLYIFIVYHIFINQYYTVAIGYFFFSFLIPPIFWFQRKGKYHIAKIIFFLFLYGVVIIISLLLLVGHDNEFYYLVTSVLILVLYKNRQWVSFFIGLTFILYILPYFLFPNLREDYFIYTRISVFFCVILSVNFFISLQKKYRAKLKEQKNHLEKLNDEKNDLMSVVAHDLKSPLSQIQGLVNILKIDKEQLSQEQLGLIEKIEQVTDIQHAQISSFLNVKALEDSIENLESEEVSVAKIIKHVLEEVQTSASAKGIKIANNSSDTELCVLGSTEGLFKVISNLISNAIKYSYSNTTVTIGVKSNRKKVLITVKDEGQGFTKEDLELVFKKNQVLSAKPTANESSSGVGLYIIKKYVARMNGNVWLESEEGKGAAFFVSLPKI